MSATKLRSHGTVLGGRNTDGLVSPTAYEGLSAWYDISDAGSLGLSGSNTRLVSDKSGNSAENGLVLNGANGNYASAPNSAPLSVAPDLDIRVFMATDSWARGDGVERYAISKYTDGANHSYVFGIIGTGALQLYVLRQGASQVAATSSASVPFSAFSSGWIRVTRVTAGSVVFYTSTDGASWTQLGTTQSTAAGDVSTSTAPLYVGTLTGTSGNIIGIIYRAQIYNGIGGTLAFDANFTTAAKLATSFTESSVNGATVTINTSGATGARIAGARDLYQGTVGSQPAYSLANRTLTFDGVDDYLKTAAFTLNQPTTVYFVGSQVTWTSERNFYDGFNGSSLTLQQSGGAGSPNLRSYAGGANFGPNLASVVLGERVLLTHVFNTPNASAKRNADAEVTNELLGNVNAGGFTLASFSNGINNGNITANEIAIYNVAHTAAQQAQFWAYARRKWGIAG